MNQPKQSIKLDVKALESIKRTNSSVEVSTYGNLVTTLSIVCYHQHINTESFLIELQLQLKLLSISIADTKMKSIFTFLRALLILAVVSAHRDPAYFRNSDDGFHNRERWMQNIPGHLKLSQLAIPGTHDSGANGSGNDILFTQCLNFDEQLRYGIRFFDIRVRHFKNSFPIHHDAFFLDKHFDQFLNSVQSFLDRNPSETVLFRLKHEYNAADNSRNMLETLDAYLKGRNRFLQTNNRDVTLDQARGKFIIMSDNGWFDSRGIHYDSSNIQDAYSLNSNWDLYSKWEKVRDHLHRAKDGDSNTFYINYLSGSTGSFPYFVASGHSNPGTSAPRLSTGRTTPGWRNSYPEFPRVSCFIGICTIAFEGTNILARDRIRQFNRSKQRRTVGIIVADFPGDDLIEQIIRNNWSI
jgi:1-phosphatidylinositol phosphodiesterase